MRKFVMVEETDFEIFTELHVFSLPEYKRVLFWCSVCVYVCIYVHLTST